MSVLDLMKSRTISLHRVCLLDPKSPRELTPEDGDGTFDWFLFGVRPRCLGSVLPDRFILTGYFGSVSLLYDKGNDELRLSLGIYGLKATILPETERVN